MGLGYEDELDWFLVALVARALHECGGAVVVLGLFLVHGLGQFGDCLYVGILRVVVDACVWRLLGGRSC